ncbi:MAG: potassium channel family protein [Candidatus Velthaea sp.]
MLAASFVVAGVVLVFLTLGDIFQSVIVPRPAGRTFRPSALVSRYGWRLWRWSAHRIGDNERREDFLGTYAPLLLVGLLIFWVALLILGYGLIFYGLRGELRPEPDFGGAVYFAGTSLLTIGYGDIAPAGALARLAAICAGASGFGVVAIVTTFLFSIFGAFQQREQFVVTFTNRAGAPPSAVEMIETHARLQITDNLAETLRESQAWMALVMETHLAYPALTYFRSQHDNISWIGVFGAILDSATIVITTLDVPQRGEALILNRLGRHFVNDFSDYFDLKAGGGAGVERSEFDTAYDRLRDAGFPMRERETAWHDFADMRATYAGRLNQIAQYWSIPPAQWIGDRSYIGRHHPSSLSADAAALRD